MVGGSAYWADDLIQTKKDINMTAINTIDDLVKVTRRTNKTTFVQDFINSGAEFYSPDFEDSEEGRRLRRNLLQNARNEMSTLVRNGMNLSVTLHDRGGRIVIVNWDVVTPENALKLRTAGFRPVKKAGEVDTKVTKRYVETQTS